MVVAVAVPWVSMESSESTVSRQAVAARHREAVPPAAAAAAVASGGRERVIVACTPMSYAAVCGVWALLLPPVPLALYLSLVSAMSLRAPCLTASACDGRC